MLEILPYTKSELYNAKSESHNPDSQKAKP